MEKNATYWAWTSPYRRTEASAPPAAMTDGPFLQKILCQKTIKNKDTEVRSKQGNSRSRKLLSETSTASSPAHLFFCCRQMEPEPSSVALQLQVSELIWPPCGGRIGFGCAEDNHLGWEDWTLPGRRESQSERPSISSPPSHSWWARPCCNLKNSVA